MINPQIVPLLTFRCRTADGIARLVGFVVVHFHVLFLSPRKRFVRDVEPFPSLVEIVDDPDRPLKLGVVVVGSSWCPLSPEVFCTLPFVTIPFFLDELETADGACPLAVVGYHRDESVVVVVSPMTHPSRSYKTNG